MSATETETETETEAEAETTEVETETGSSGTTTKKTKKKRTRKTRPANYKLCEVAQIEDGRTIFIPIDYPEGVDEDKLTNRDSIERAIRQACEEGDEESVTKYGGKTLVVVSFYDGFKIEVEEKKTVHAKTSRVESIF